MSAMPSVTKSLALVAVLLACASLSSARSLSAAMPKKYASVWDFMQSRPDLRSFTSTAAQFPDIALRLADPDLVATLLIPSDRSSGQSSFIPVNKKGVDSLTLVKHLLGTSDLLNPGFDVHMSGSSTKRLNWQAVLVHALLDPKAIKSSTFAKGGSYAMAQPYVNISFNKNAFVQNYLDGRYKVLEANLPAGKSIIHIIDGVFSPDIAPPDSYATIEEGVHTGQDTSSSNIYQQIIRSANSLFNVSATEVPLTVFAPSDAALSSWLESKKMSLGDLLKDAAACAKLVKAHSVPSSPAVWSALYLHDLVAIAAADLYDVPSSNYMDINKTASHAAAFHNLNGDTMWLKTTFKGLDGYSQLKVAFQPASSSASEPSAWGHVTDYDFGGNEAGADMSGVVSVLHIVDKVLA